MLENIKSNMHLGIDELFAAAAVDEMAGDGEAYRARLAVIGLIAELLGMDTEITTATLQLKPETSKE